MELLPFLSVVFGWVYTVCWSLSFYPQPILNFRRKSTSGTTVDFPLINCLGFLSYLVSNLAFYYSPLIRDQYKARHHGLTPTVQFNDIAFAAHALLLSCITTSQYIPGLWGFQASTGTRPSRFILGIGSGCLLGVAAVVFLVAGSSSSSSSSSSPAAAIDGLAQQQQGWVWLDAVYAVSYVKLLITLIKYTPQIVANWRNRSTQGWSIGQILLDFSGGVLSIAQQAIDSYLQRDWSGISGNPVKFALGNVSMLYDLVFFTQHYLLYPGAGGGGKAGERDALLRDDEERRLD